MLYREVIAVCSGIHTKPMNMLCGQNVELLIVKHFGTDFHVRIQFVPRSKHSPSQL